MTLQQIDNFSISQVSSGNLLSALTLLNARLRQFFAVDRSPFFQIQLPKHSQASARDGFNLICCIEIEESVINHALQHQLQDKQRHKLTT